MGDLFYTTLIYPFFNILVFLYNVTPGHDLGVAIIFLTIIIKLLLYPLSMKSVKAQKALQDLQPHMDEIKKKYKNDKEKQSKELMKLYQKKRINPLSSCLPLLIQLPVLLALYRVFQFGFDASFLENLYPFVSNPGTLDPLFFGFLDLSVPNSVLAVAAGIFQFIQSKMMQVKKKKQEEKGAENGKKAEKKDNVAGFDTSAISSQLTYIMPVVTVVFALGFPAGLALYWIVSTLFAIGQQWYIMRKDTSNKTDATRAN